MGCGSCSSGSCGTATSPGCKNNGACHTGGCNKLNSFDWLGDMDLPSEQKFDIVEVKFKGGKKEFFRNTEKLPLFTGDPVVVEVQNGYHIGYVSLQGEIVRLQMLKKSVDDNETVRQIYRVATKRDQEKWEQVLKRELPTMYRTREIIRELKLEMKLTDVEFQADNTKATFYYSADDRVDFRELIKILASEFKIRVEMRQISLRQEASRLGGIGSCGRELCCSTWLTDFKSVSTAAARYQNLSLNPSKLSGQCGRLKCCLNYELETYLDALVDIPKVEIPLKTIKGDAQLEKVDIFKKILWFSFVSESTWHPVPSKRVAEIINLNKKGIAVDSLNVDPNLTVQPPLDKKPERKKRPTNRPAKAKRTNIKAGEEKANVSPETKKKRYPKKRRRKPATPPKTQQNQKPKPTTNKRKNNNNNNNSNNKKR
ncbi:regulatory iron-sulfur-containing complex subunit RicT [Rapidithrix thailandica]|uniref:Regulatory iron-sulfur-containing complex subunit RicT n=1 Tax=Rapidithrix thailandica TaxID=413964 RepID=A0AAW9S4Y7_9BACT